MSTISPEAREQDLHSLETRITQLEQIIFDSLNRDDFDKETQNVSNLMNRLETLLERYQKLEGDNDDIKNLIEKYTEYQNFLEKDINDSPNVNTSEKKSNIIISF